MKPYMCMHGMLNPKTYIWMRNISGTTMHDSSSERSSRDLYAHLKIVTIYGMVDPKHIHGTSPLFSTHVSDYLQSSDSKTFNIYGPTDFVSSF